MYKTAFAIRLLSVVLCIGVILPCLNETGAGAGMLSATDEENRLKDPSGISESSGDKSVFEMTIDELLMMEIVAASRIPEL